MGPIGYQEMVLIFIVALLLFGPKKLPEIGRTVAKALGEFRKASADLKETWQREMAAIDRETQDVRSELHEEVQKLTESTTDYSQNYYGSQDSSYDYGAYGYPDSQTDTNAATAAAVGEGAAQLESGAATAEAPGAADPGTEYASAGEPVSTIESAPPVDVAPAVTPAAGAVPTTPAALPHAAPPETPAA
jgi:TatA/E family protein of Tat protein translocase